MVHSYLVYSPGVSSKDLDRFELLNTNNSKNFSLLIALVAVNPRHRIPLSLLSIIQSSREQYKWKIKITQLRCANVDYIKGKSYLISNA